MAFSRRGSGRTRAQRRYTPSRPTPLPAGTGGATQIGSKRAFQIKLKNGLTSSRVTTIFDVPRRLDRTPVDSARFSLLWVGPQAHVELGSHRKNDELARFAALRRPPKSNLAIPPPALVRFGDYTSLWIVLSSDVRNRTLLCSTDADPRRLPPAVPAKAVARQALAHPRALAPGLHNLCRGD